MSKIILQPLSEFTKTKPNCSTRLDGISWFDIFCYHPIGIGLYSYIIISLICRPVLAYWRYWIHAFDIKFSSTVVDSMGKVESGLLTGNIRWTGRYSECVEASSTSMETKWCTFHVGRNQKEKVQVRSLQIELNYMFTSWVSSIWCFQVQLTTDNSLSIGLCIPRPCSEDAMNNAVSHLTAFTNISIQIKCPIQPTVWTGVDIFSL